MTSLIFCTLTALGGQAPIPSWIEARLAEKASVRATTRSEKWGFQFDEDNLLSRPYKGTCQVKTIKLSWQNPNASKLINQKLDAKVQAAILPWRKKATAPMEGSLEVSLKAISKSVISCWYQCSEWSGSASLSQHYLTGMNYVLEGDSLKPLTLARFINWGKENEFWAFVTSRLAAASLEEPRASVKDALLKEWHLTPKGMHWAVDLVDGRGRYVEFDISWQDLGPFLRPNKA